MNKVIYILGMLFMVGSMQAQRTPLDKYPLVPEMFYNTFFDYVRFFPACHTQSSAGEYIGQANADGVIYGYGSYHNESGQKVGLFRDGVYEFGIYLTGSSAIVGTAFDNVQYSLSTGRIEYIVRSGQATQMQVKDTAPYAFVSMKYPNGDRYIGEIYQNRRHGFGLYFYADGGFWFGQYNEGLCQGPGCLFRMDDTMRLGLYDKGYEKRACEVLPRKKK